jgi:hypothetical protein
MPIDKGPQIPNSLVYGALYVILFGISIWILLVDRDGPTNWILYTAMTVAVLAGLLKLGFRKRTANR